MRFHKVVEAGYDTTFEMCSENEDRCGRGLDSEPHRVYTWGNKIEQEGIYRDIGGVRVEMLQDKPGQVIMSRKAMAEEVIALEQERLTEKVELDVTALVVAETSL